MAPHLRCVFHPRIIPDALLVAARDGVRRDALSSRERPGTRERPSTGAAISRAGTGDAVRREKTNLAWPIFIKH